MDDPCDKEQTVARLQQFLRQFATEILGLELKG